MQTRIGKTYVNAYSFFFKWAKILKAIETCIILAIVDIH